VNGAFLQLSQLTCRTGHFCLDGLDLEVPAGEYLMITGPTGSGKTMLLELIAGLRKPTAGRIFLNGAEITAWLPERRALGFAYQDSLLYPFLTVRDNILFGAQMSGRLKETGLRERGDYLAEVMEIGHLRDRYPRWLSGGEKQRVSLARALLLQPPLLLLDEPLSALDGRTRQTIRELLRQLHEREKMTVLHVTHDPEDLDRLGTGAVELERGRLRKQSTIDN
jgi:molybdate transport system ATP-binding protein